jgi:acyl carrier protein
MSRDDSRAVLTQLFRQVLDNPALEPRPEDSEADIPGLDSGRKIMLILAVEERFGLRLRSREVDALRRFGDWVNLIDRRRADAS